MKKNIFIIGNFGGSSNDLNGQTVRTRTIHKILQKQKGFKVSYFDTSYKGFKSTIIYLKGLLDFTFSKKLILLPAQRAIKFINPIIYFLNFILRKEIYFVAIGGWLGDYLNENHNNLKYFSKMTYIYVQTESLKTTLEKKGLKNVVYFPNFRDYKNNNISSKNIQNVRKVIFFSRVMKEKGIELAIEAIQKINNNRNIKVQLHIYGPIRENYAEKFEGVLRNSTNTSYKGVLEPNEILSTISQYDLLLFPTYYIGEGFPGTLLDAITAGVPVIASDWKYNGEIIKEGETGVLFYNQDIEDFVKKINKVINNPDLINNMSANCIKESNKYKESNVSPILLDTIRK